MSYYSNNILYFDEAALVVFVITLISLTFRGMTKGYSSSVFLYFTIVSLICTVADICSEKLAFGAFPRQSDFFPQLFIYIYFLTRSMSPILFVVFVSSVIGVCSKVRKNTKFYMAVFIPFLFVFATILINPIFNILFTFDENGVYQRGSHVWLIYAFSLAYLLCGLFLLLKYFKYGKFESLFPMFFIMVINFAAVLVQFLFPHVLIELFASAMTVLVITVSLLRTESMIDPILKILTRHEFFNVCSKYNDLSTPYNIVLIVAKNSKNMLSIYGEDEFASFQKNLVNTINSVIIEKRVRYDFFRISGETFAIITPPNDEESLDLAKKIEKNILNMDYSKAENIEINYNFCVFSCPKEAKNIVELQSFIRVFRKGNFCDSGIFYLPEVEDRRNFDLLVNINKICNRSLENKSFKMYYQPIFSFKDNKFVSAEALMRLNDKDFGEISPEFFIEEAERNGNIHHLGDYMLEASFKFISENNLKALGLDYLELNLSACQCMEVDIVQKITELSKRYNVSPKQVNFEITESANVWNTARFNQNIKVLESLGYEITLDDYGKGYSSMERFLTLPISLIKLDKSFVKSIKQEDVELVIKDTIRLMKSIGKKVLIEGVESKEAAANFNELGCDFVQGYYYSKPLPEDQFVNFLHLHNK